MTNSIELNRTKVFKASMDRVKKNQKKDQVTIADTVTKRIVALSFQHPDYGARRLIPLLEKEKISLSASTIYRILRRNGLQTRAKRMSALKRQATETAPINKKTKTDSEKLTEERVKALSLQNPDYGARRLFFLLEKEKIFLTESTISSILRRHGLQNRTLRLSKLAEQQVSGPPIVKKVENLPDKSKLVAATRPVSLTREKTRRKILTKEKLILNCINIMLLAVLVYLGLQAKMSFSQLLISPETLYIAAKAQPTSKKVSENSVPPLGHYKGIWEGNLFKTKTSQKKHTVSKKTDLELLKSIPIADDDHGLELRGTVIIDSSRSVAVIYQRFANHMDIFKQGDRVGRAVIKKILRNKIIINNGKGDELLTLDLDDFSKSAKKKPPYRLKLASMTQRINHRKVNLNRQEFESSLENLDRHWDSMQFAPHLNDGQPEGIIIKGLKNKNPLFKMGVRNGDVIKSINEQEYQNPDQADEIFNQIEQGNGYKITLLRGKSHYELDVTIQ